MILTLSNVEKIFYDKSARSLLPEHEATFSKWTFGSRTGQPAVVKDAAIELLSGLTVEQLVRLRAVFGEEVSVRGPDKRLSHNLSDFNFPEGSWNVVLSVDGDKKYVTLWR